MSTGVMWPFLMNKRAIQCLATGDLSGAVRMKTALSSMIYPGATYAAQIQLGPPGTLLAGEADFASTTAVTNVQTLAGAALPLGGLTSYGIHKGDFVIADNNTADKAYQIESVAAGGITLKAAADFTGTNEPIWIVKSDYLKRRYILPCFRVSSNGALAFTFMDEDGNIVGDTHYLDAKGGAESIIPLEFPRGKRVKADTATASLLTSVLAWVFDEHVPTV